MEVTSAKMSATEGTSRGCVADRHNLHMRDRREHGQKRLGGAAFARFERQKPAC